MIKYYWFCIRWLWRHRYWESSRQKRKAMEREWKRVKKHG